MLVDLTLFANVLNAFKKLFQQIMDFICLIYSLHSFVFLKEAGLICNAPIFKKKSIKIVFFETYSCIFSFSLCHTTQSIFTLHAVKLFKILIFFFNFNQSMVAFTQLSFFEILILIVIEFSHFSACSKFIVPNAVWKSWVLVQPLFWINYSTWCLCRFNFDV